MFTRDQKFHVLATVIIVVASLSVPQAGALAQEQRLVQQGQQVRIYAPECGIDGQIGSFDGLRGDTLLLVYGTSTVRCVRSSVSKIQVYSGRKRNLIRGALTGLVIGAGVGAIPAAIAEASGERFCMMNSCYAAGTGTAFGALLFGIPGLVIGTVTGALHKTDRWKEVPLDRLRIGFTPGQNRFEVGISIAF